MADIDTLDRISRLERTLNVVVTLMHNGLNKEAQQALDATGFTAAMAPQQLGLTQSKAAWVSISDKFDLDQDLS